MNNIHHNDFTYGDVVFSVSNKFIDFVLTVQLHITFDLNNFLKKIK